MSMILVFIQNAISQGICILLGANGEIITEKSGNLNLGIPGIMYIGGVAGLLGAFFYENSVSVAVPIIGFLIATIFSLLFSAIAALLYSFLTITLKANQNVVGLALTTFGIGFGNFFGGSISKMAGGVGQVSVAVTASAFQSPVPLLNKIPVIGELLFSYGFLTYFSVVLVFATAFVLNKTRLGLNLRAVGENPATADAAGINVSRYKYVATIIGGAIAGLGGLYFVMEYLGGTWTNNGFGERGWLAIAVVIFALWDTRKALLGALLFGALSILYMYLPGLSRGTQELFKMVQYIVTILILVGTSMRKNREDQPPESLGVAYFREDR